jgi:iron(III) transport system substrate-binding protein
LHLGASQENTNSVIDDRGSPPADLLLTDNIADIWSAADQGALRPIANTSLDAVPAHLRDPDATWIALNYRRAVILINSSASDASPDRYADLAKHKYKNNLCLVSSSAPLSRALIAMLIHDLGRRPAELIVRGWMRNLAVPPFQSEAKLLAAIQAGTCAYGISSENVGGGINHVVPAGAYIDVDAIGVVRHARYPESAQRLMDWLLEHSDLDTPAGTNENNVGIAGLRAEEARLLAERAGYR